MLTHIYENKYLSIKHYNWCWQPTYIFCDKKGWHHNACFDWLASESVYDQTKTVAPVIVQDRSSGSNEFIENMINACIV